MPKTPRTYISVELKRAVTERAQGRCEYCQCRADHATEPFAVEHIIPLSRGGKTVLENLAFSCSGCNGHKYNRVEAFDQVTEEWVAIFHPRLDRWLDHFSWDNDYTEVVGLTPIGRATILALRLNRPPLINIRESLCATGKHPPQLD